MVYSELSKSVKVPRMLHRRLICPPGGKEGITWSFPASHGTCQPQLQLQVLPKIDQALDKFNQLVNNAEKNGHSTDSRSQILKQLSIIRTEDSTIAREHRRVLRAM